MLPRLARLNVAMDRRAKAYWTHLVRSSTDTPVPEHIFIHEESWQLWHGLQKIVHPTVDTLYGSIQDPITQFWWRRHGHTTLEAQSLIDFDATETHVDSLPGSRRRWLVKHASENCGVNSVLVEWKCQDDPSCPRCSCPCETTEHVVVCSGCDADVPWQKSFKAVDTYLATHHTCPVLHQALLHCLTAWRRGRRVDLFAFPHTVRVAIRHQTKIGWLDLLEGQPARQWSLLQSRYAKTQGMRQSIRKWMRGLLLKLHHLAWNQWDHRNQCKQKYPSPNDKKALNMLDKAIVSHMTTQHDSVMHGDRHHFRHNIISLLKKPLHHKQDWLSNVVAAKQRHQRILHQDDSLTAISKADSQLLHFFKYGHFRMKKPPRSRSTEDQTQSNAPPPT